MSSRREFLKAALALSGAAAVGMPGVARTLENVRAGGYVTRHECEVMVAFSLALIENIQGGRRYLFDASPVASREPGEISFEVTRLWAGGR